MSNMTAITPGSAAPPRQVGLPVRDTPVGTVITAEIPAVHAGPSYGVLLPDGTVWYPGSPKRLPAPLILRVVVWILAFAVFLAAAGDIIIHERPSWVGPLRHIVPAQSLASSGTTLGTQPSGSHGNGGGAAVVTLASPQPAAPSWSKLPFTAYTLNKASYNLAVTAGSHEAWVSAQIYATQQQPPILQQSLLQPGKTMVVSLKDARLVEIAAGGTTIDIYDGFTKVATVPTPPHCPCLVLLQPGH
jgi:hypothetical protein